MNLIEAIKSGKPWKYPGGGDTWWQLERRVTLIPDADQVHAGPQHRDILDLLECNDFKIQEPSVTITASQFWDAVNSSTSVELGDRVFLTYDDTKKLACRLGLEPK